MLDFSLKHRGDLEISQDFDFPCQNASSNTLQEDTQPATQLIQMRGLGHFRVADIKELVYAIVIYIDIFNMEPLVRC